MAGYIDISMPIRDGMLSWPSDPDVSLKPFKTLEEKGSNVSELRAGTHLGTHVDAPWHNLADGSGVDEYEPEIFLGPVVVVGATGANSEVLPEHLPDPAERIIFKTQNTERKLLEQPFTEDYVGLSAAAAKELSKWPDLKLVGIDYLSVQRRGPDSTPHTALLERGIAILEGLVLTDVPAGSYELVCLPLRIEHGDGAPARAFLKQV